MTPLDHVELLVECKTLIACPVGRMGCHKKSQVLDNSSYIIINPNLFLDE